MNENVCCFTGHREIGDDLTVERIKIAIEKMIEDGVDTFISGGAVGFDTLAGFAVHELKEKHPHIKLHIYVPCKNQDYKFSAQQKRDYKRLLEIADLVKESDAPPSKQAFLARDRRMVDDSGRCICYLNKPTGGTAYTVRYAISKGITSLNVAVRKANKSAR